MFFRHPSDDLMSETIYFGYVPSITFYKYIWGSLDM